MKVINSRDCRLRRLPALGALLIAGSQLACIQIWSPQSCDDQPTAAQSHAEFDGAVLYVSGAGGERAPELALGGEDGLRAGGFVGEFEVVHWNTGFGLVFDHVIDNGYKRAAASRLAARIEELHGVDPEAPLCLLAHSAGAVIATYAMEALPPGCHACQRRLSAPGAGVALRLLTRADPH